MQTIKSVNVMSFAKVVGALYGAMGLLVIPIMLIAALAGISTGQTSGLGLVGLMALALIAPLFYGGMGFLFGALMAWVYNMMAKWVGGIQIELAPTVIPAETNRIGLI